MYICIYMLWNCNPYQYSEHIKHGLNFPCNSFCSSLFHLLSPQRIIDLLTFTKN
jgi:hypothetical protein